ncbi:hypothetical protein EAH57_00530 [Acinetobacter sp. 2JN-4]|nr:hypothetical protein EAH57_00530 [Acinetobacter sp. 2JN-4]
MNSYLGDFSNIDIYFFKLYEVTESQIVYFIERRSRTFNTYSVITDDKAPCRQELEVMVDDKSDSKNKIDLNNWLNFYSWSKGIYLLRLWKIVS